MSLTLFVVCSLWQGSAQWGILYATCYILLELAIVSVAAIFFSTILVTPILAGLLTAAVFIAGRMSDFLPQLVANFKLEGAARFVIEIIHAVLPKLNDLALSDRIVFNEAIPLVHLLWSTLYAIGYCTVVLGVACYIFRKREFN
jgi:hypothetical protein